MMFSASRITEFIRRALGPSVLVLVAAVFFAVMTRGIDLLRDPEQPLVTPGSAVVALLLMLAVVAAALVPFWFAGRFARDLYALSGIRSGASFVARNRFGTLGFKPWMRVMGSRIDLQSDQALSQSGGPGNMIVGRDTSVMLEAGGRFTRAVGPGIAGLKPFERIYGYVDLRPRLCPHRVSAMTVEGIPIRWDVEVRYQVADQVTDQDAGPDRPPRRGAQYEFSPSEAFCAATSRWVRESGWDGDQDMDWEGLLVAYYTDDILRSMLELRSLDELVGWIPGGGKTAREWLQDQLFLRLRTVAPELGAQVLSVTLGNLEVEDEVTEQWIKAWSVEWENWAAKELAEGEGDYISRYETAKAQAQIDMVAAVTDELRGLLREANEDGQPFPPDAVPQYVLMRLFSVLDRADFASASRVFFPAETLEALENVRRSVAMQTRPEADEILMAVDQQDIPANGQAVVTATVLDAAGNPLPNGTPVTFTTNLGTIVPGNSRTSNGQATAVFTAGSEEGEASVLALAAGGEFGRIWITIG